MNKFLYKNLIHIHSGPIWKNCSDIIALHASFRKDIFSKKKIIFSMQKLDFDRSVFDS